MAILYCQKWGERERASPPQCIHTEGDQDFSPREIREGTLRFYEVIVCCWAGNNKVVLNPCALSFLLPPPPLKLVSFSTPECSIRSFHVRGRRGRGIFFFPSCTTTTITTRLLVYGVFGRRRVAKQISICGRLPSKLWRAIYWFQSDQFVTAHSKQRVGGRSHPFTSKGPLCNTRDDRRHHIPKFYSDKKNIVLHLFAPPPQKK